MQLTDEFEHRLLDSALAAVALQEGIAPDTLAQLRAYGLGSIRESGSFSRETFALPSPHLTGRVLSVFSSYDRPALLATEHTFDLPASGPWREVLELNRVAIERVLPRVGRIVRGAATLGTGFSVDGNRLLTNWHVAQHFARKAGAVYALTAEAAGPAPTIGIDFLSLKDNPARRKARFSRVVAVDEENDLALLEYAGDNCDLARLPLGGDTPENMAVAAIGFPSEEVALTDSMKERYEIVFGGHYDVKRVSPGKVRASAPGVITHDCSTLGGSSGSPIIDLQSGALVGLHRRGGAHSNAAVAAQVLESFLAAN